ncbi:hypothetical protein [uncultured Alistipes sp.]|uniref:hypothetical protein n=1 Tax=uncultured Alistipes sp. TaxID=538949 RepID=UPI00262441E3|nr:hypothetical protein [uncultured Alistipes sp.]
MKTMQDFAAQQLTKKEMTEIHGGANGFDNCGILYAVTWSGGTSYVCSKNTAEMEYFRAAGTQFIPA